MKNRNYFRAAALVLAVLMALGLAACGGSGGQSEQPQPGNSTANNNWYGKWVSNDRSLWFSSDFDGVAIMNYFDYPDENYGYSYTIKGNVMELTLEVTPENEDAPDAPDTMKLTLDSDQLVAGDAVYTRHSNSVEDYQPPVNEFAHSQSEPVETNPPAASTGITGIWQNGPGVFAFYDDFVLVYEFGSGDDGDLRFAYLKNLYDGSYTLSGNTLSLSIYEMDGTPVNDVVLTLDGNTLYNDYDGNDRIVKVSDNNGVNGDLVGTWHCMGDEFRFGSSAGTQMQFYSDGTYTISLEDDSDRKGGSYVLTSQYDLPAVMLLDENGEVIGTYPYEFLENDLLMIYVYDIDLGGYVFYRAS